MLDTPVYLPENLAPSMDSWTLTNATFADGKLTINNGGKGVFIITDPDGMLSANKIKFDFKFETLNVLSRYNPYGMRCLVKINYTSDDIKPISSLITFNSDVVDSPNVYIDSSEIIPAIGEISSIEVGIYNNESNSLILHSFGVFLSRDIAPMQLVEVLKSESARFGVLQATLNFSDALLTQYIETNLKQKLVYNNTSGGGERDFIVMQEEELALRTSNLSNTTQEQLIINIPHGDGSYKNYPIFYADINPDHEGHHESYTVIDPMNLYPTITPEQYDAFKVKIWTSDSTLNKLLFRFEEFEQSGETVKIPVIYEGAGTGIGDNGKNKRYKDVTGHHDMYITSTGNNIIDIIKDDTGGYLKGFYARIESVVEHLKADGETLDGYTIKFLGDVNAYIFKCMYDVDDNFIGFTINDDDYIPFTISGPLS